MSKRFTITRPGDGTNVPVGNKNNKQPGAGAFKITRHVKTEDPTYVEKTVRCPIPIALCFEKVNQTQVNSKYKLMDNDYVKQLTFVTWANIETEKGFAGLVPWYNYNCTYASIPLTIPYAGAYDVDDTLNTTEYIHPTWIDQFAHAAANSECEITITPYTGTLQLPDSGPGTIYASGGNITTMDATALPGISPFTLKGTIKKLTSVPVELMFDSTCKGNVPALDFGDGGETFSAPFIPLYRRYPNGYGDEDAYNDINLRLLESVMNEELTFADEDNIEAFAAFLDEMDEGGYFGTDITLPGPKVGYNKCDEAWDSTPDSFVLFSVDITFTEVDPGVVQENEERRSWKLIHKDDKGIGHNIGTSSQTIENGGFETDPNVAEKVFPAEYDEFGNLIRPAQAEYCAENGIQKVVKNRPKIDRTIATEFASEN